MRHRHQTEQSCGLPTGTTPRGTAAPARGAAAIVGQRCCAATSAHQGRMMVALCSVSTGNLNEGKSCTASLPRTPILALFAGRSKEQRTRAVVVRSLLPSRSIKYRYSSHVMYWSEQVGHVPVSLEEASTQKAQRLRCLITKSMLQMSESMISQHPMLLGVNACRSVEGPLHFKCTETTLWLTHTMKGRTGVCKPKRSRF
jgi:hypothetical protein